MNILKFLIDVGVGKKVENFLIESGHDVKSIRTINNRMDDKNILELASEEKRIVVTMDKDFGELFYHSQLANEGILILRLEDMN